jgi:hypothetical protein
VGTLKNGFYQLVARLLLVCLVASHAAAGDFWVKKPYQNWSADETQQMLVDSPWAKTVTLAGLTGAASAPLENSPGVEMESNPSITYTVQFRSAQPIREAQVRSSQLSSHYDKMSAEQKAAFDANMGKFLAVTFPDRVVVSVTFHTDVQNYASLLRVYWAKQSLPTLGKSTYLNTRDERLTLTGYVFKDDTFQFVFPRPKQLRPDDKISVEFVHPRIAAIGEQRVFQEFNLKKMVVNGVPAF